MNTTLTPFYDKQVQCLHCEAKFPSTKIRSSFVKVDRYDKDFCPNYQSEELNPLFYHVFVCPQCGFSFTDDFSKYFPPKTKEEIKNNVSDRWVHQDYGKQRTVRQAIDSYKLAAYCAEIKKEKKVTIAGLYMRIAWLNRKMKNKEQEQRFITFALHNYLECYINSDYHSSQMSELKIMYLIAALSHQIGETEQAIMYLSKVIEKQNTTTERTIIEMAKDQWQEIRGEKSTA
jgi:uncharacterized protein (DUF2225 family)